jgi:peroxiredoxin
LVALKLKEGAFMAKVSINTQAPEFTSKDVHGNTVSLSGFANKKNVLLVFNRGFI